MMLPGAARARQWLSIYGYRTEGSAFRLFSVRLQLEGEAEVGTRMVKKLEPGLTAAFTTPPSPKL
jgi:hypothetical protein